MSSIFFNFLHEFFPAFSLTLQRGEAVSATHGHCATCTISGSRGTQILLKLPIDKLRGRWYNGNSARVIRARAGDFITLLEICQQSKCTKIKAGWVSYSHPAFQQAVCTLLPQICFLSLIPTATKRTSEKKTWWRSLSLRKEHFQKNPGLIILTAA